MRRFDAFFFDMDGVLFDSMPNHALAWEEVMKKHGLQFSARDTYINEGRTGFDVIKECFMLAGKPMPSEDVVNAIYKEKSDNFSNRGESLPIDGVKDVLAEIQSQNVDIWIVTGSGQHTLFDRLERVFPHTFSRDKMITAFDVVHGKPDPEPYQKAWQRSGKSIDRCAVVENAPLGVRAAKKAGIFTIAVNTGILTRADLEKENADIIFDDMYQLLSWLKQIDDNC